MSKEAASELIRARDLEAFDVWRLPAFDSFDEPEEIPAPAAAEPGRPGDQGAWRGWARRTASSTMFWATTTSLS